MKCHTTTLIFGVSTFQWPVASPDFSPIEQVWDQLDIKIRPQTLNELFNALREECNSSEAVQNSEIS